MQAILQTIRHEFLLKINKLDNIVPRALVIPAMPHKIKVIIGMRRVGKTFYLLEKIQKLLAQGVPFSNILYLSLEDDRLQTFDAQQLSLMIEAFYALYPNNHRERCYLFLDEIHVVEGWSHFIRRLQDTKDVDIYLTGSSSKLLSTEIATELRGRSISYELWPFSFMEYCDAKKIFVKKPTGQIELDETKQILTQYLLEGGFPEIVLMPFSEKHIILQEYVDVVIYRDIIERYKISNLSLVKQMLKILLKNPAIDITLNKFYHSLKSQGYSVGRTTVYDYLEYITDAYLAFMVPLYSESIKQIQANPRKIYVVDTGLCCSYNLNINLNLGHLFENMIYLDLRRRRDTIHYYATDEKYNVDFLTRSLTGDLNLYQVAWDISDQETLKREQRALNSAEKKLNIVGKIITPESYLKGDDF